MHSMKKSDKGGREKYSIKYSVDKVKIEFQYIKSSVVQQFMDRLMSNSCDIEYTTYYESNKMTNCKHNFYYGKGAGAIYLGVIPNWKKEERHDKSIVIEYNPNKTDPFIFDVFLWLSKLSRVVWHVMNFDIATDIMLSYDTVFMNKRDKREEMGMRGHSNVETRYLGALGNGHIKLYDKAKEQKLEGVDWTRFEITVKEINHPTATLDDFKKVCKVPTLYRKDIQLCTLEINDIWNIAVEGIIQNPDLLYTIKNYNSRKKMEKVLGECLEGIPISVDDMYKTYLDFFCRIGKDSLEIDGECINVNGIFEKQENDRKRTANYFKYKKTIKN